MPQDVAESLKSVVGPYESWLFAAETAKFAGEDAALGKGDQIVALAEIDPRHWLADDGQGAGPGMINIGNEIAAAVGGDLLPLKPQIWRPMVEAARKGLAVAPHGAASLFLPLVLRSTVDPDSPEQGHVWANLDGRLSTLLAFGDMSTFSALPRPRPQLTPEPGLRLNGKLLRGSFDESYAANPKPPGITGETRTRNLAGRSPICLLAVIDDGLAFAHPTLLDGQGQPRMECCWLQSATPAPNGKGTVLFGRELLRQDIATLVQECHGDEDRLYRAAGQFAGTHGPHPLAGRASHGAHVLSLAAGRRPGDDGDALDRIRLIGVELPPALVTDTVGFGKDAYVLAAFHYIFDRADRIAKAYGVERLPLVINFSFGFTGGPHDGTDRLEAAVQAMIEARGPEITELVMPAGNHFQARLHGVVTAKAGDAEGRFTIPWRVQPDDRTSNYLEVWYPAERAARPGQPVIRNPAGRQAELVPMPGASASATQTIWTITHDGTATSTTIGQVSLDRFRGNRWRLMVILAPTDAAGAGWLPAPAGTWQITINAGEAGAGEITCRIQRDQTVRSVRRHGRQSYFDHPGDKVFGPDDQPLDHDAQSLFVRRFGTLNGLSTQPHCTVVAGFRNVAAKGRRLPARYSSAGAVGARTTGGAHVDMAAASDTSPARPGIRCAGSRAGATGRLSGTSAASPQAARVRAFGHVTLPSSPQGTIPQPDQALLDRLGTELVD